MTCCPCHGGGEDEEGWLPLRRWRSTGGHKCRKYDRKPQGHGVVPMRFGERGRGIERLELSLEEVVDDAWDDKSIRSTDRLVITLDELDVPLLAE